MGEEGGGVGVGVGVAVQRKNPVNVIRETIVLVAVVVATTAAEVAIFVASIRNKKR